MTANAIPDGYGTVTPWIICKDSAKLIEFLERAFNAKELPGSRIKNPDGSIGHVEMRLGNSIIMLFDSHASWGPTAAFLRLYVSEVDSVHAQALSCGAREVTKPTDLFWGDRVGRVRDPFGNIWWLQTHVADISAEQMESRKRDPVMIKAMQYVQQSLDVELGRAPDMERPVKR